jgi:2-keto-4-pentenoate hydratase
MVDISSFAARQLRDYDARAPGTLFSQGISLNEEEAYAIQAEVSRLREKRGERVIGYKIGCLSAVVQEQLGIDHPIFGRLFASECQESGVELSLNRFTGLAIEGELAIRLMEKVPSTGADDDRILRCVSSVFPVIELHNYVLRGPHPAATELIANNGLHAGFVMPSEDLGVPSSDNLSLRILLNGGTVVELPRFPWRETIVRSVAELSSLLATHGLSLGEGQIVLTGSLAELIRIPAATNVEVDIPNHGRVAACFVCANRSSHDTAST